MARNNEAADAVTDTRPFAGAHILATAILCANGASDAELELARRILERDPKRDAPREAESIAGAFNRHMDAAIESCNGSQNDPTRATRRATLAHDLERAGLVLVDRDIVAALMVRIGELREERTAALLLAGACGMNLVEMVEHLKAQAGDTFPDEDDGEDEVEELGAELVDGEAIAGDYDANYSGLEFIEQSGERVMLDPSVND